MGHDIPIHPGDPVPKTHFNLHNIADEEDDRLGELNSGGPFMFAGEETRSRFTEYSMSSSVVSRNKHLRYRNASIVFVL